MIHGIIYLYIIYSFLINEFFILALLYLHKIVGKCSRIISPILQMRRLREVTCR